MRKVLQRALLIGAFGTALMACSRAGAAHAVVMGPSLMRVGASEQFNAWITTSHVSPTAPAGAPQNGQVTWLSQYPAIATVSATGLVTAVTPGTTVISAEPPCSSNNPKVCGAARGVVVPTVVP